MQNTQEIVQVVEGKVKNAVAQVAELKIKTDEDLTSATELLTNVKKLSKWLTSEKEKIIKPMREAMNAARGLFAPLEDQVGDAEKKIKSVMITYQTKKEAEQKKKEESIEKRVESGQLKEDTGVRKLEELGEVKSNVKVESGAAAFKKVKVARVVDEDKVPDRFWRIDMVLVRTEALAVSKSTGKLGEVIPGIVVEEEMGVAATV